MTAAEGGSAPGNLEVLLRFDGAPWLEVGVAGLAAERLRVSPASALRRVAKQPHWRFGRAPA